MKFIDRSLKNVLDFFKEAILSDEIARSKGLLQSVDTRIKIGLLVLFLIITCLVRTVPALIVLYLFSLILAALSGVNLLFFLKRVWFFIPIFAVFIAIPAVFIQGLYSSFIFVLRIATCVSFVVAVTITTRHNLLLKSLRSIGVPGIFVQVLDMTYRYVFLFIKIFEEMHLSLKSRLIRKMEGSRARHWIASRITSLFRKSLKMSDDVYMAMIARGYTIEAKEDGK